MSRSIFEEVSDDAPAKAAGAPAGGGGAEARRAADRRRLRLWLLVLAAMVVIQILVGGLTRLTDSGLSITEWNLFTGILPPLSEAGWLSEFDKYKTTTEFKEQNSAMTLAEFKVIYWWEWAHRFWGRVIGLAFFIPFGFFYFRKQVPTGYTPRLAGIGALIVVQGAIGWWMVTSGLVERTDVSQYRLALHLGLAFVLLGLLFWTALALKRPEWELLAAKRRREAALYTLAWAITGFVLLQIVMGAFVAGMDGGIVYPQWPLMGDGFYPSGEPFLPTENPAAAQFTHRLLGYLLLGASVYAWWRFRRSAFAKTRLWANLLLGGVIVQSVIGIVTVVTVAPLEHLWLALLHQLGGIAVFTIAIHMLRQNGWPEEQKLAA